MSYDVLAPAAARLWPYAPDWRGGFDVQRTFETDIAVSRNNTEQRRSLRINPRFAINFRTVVSGADLRDATQLLRATQNKPTLIADYARWHRTTGSSLAGASTLTIAAAPAWIAAGQPLVLCGVSRERVIVLSVAGSTVTLTAPLAAAWPSGSVVRPTFFGLLDARISSRRLTHGAAELSVVLEAYAGGSPPRSAGVAYATVNPSIENVAYASWPTREVFTLDPDYSSSPALSHLWPVEQVDFDRGRTAQFRPVDRGERAIEGEYAGLTLAQAAALEQFFDRMKGRRGAFFLPTGEKDFDLLQRAESGSLTFLSKGTTIADDFGALDYEVNEYGVAFYLTHGERIHRRIVDISSTGANSQVTLAGALPRFIEPQNIARISLMPLCRFASDDMTTSWQTPLAARARLTFQTVKR